MLNERERAHLEDTATMDLKSELRLLGEELDSTYQPRRRQWIAARISFIEGLIEERKRV